MLEAAFKIELTDEKIKELILIGEELGYDYVIDISGETKAVQRSTGEVIDS